MPRPKTERKARSLRLPKPADDLLVAEAGRRGLTVTAAIEQAVLHWAAPIGRDGEPHIRSAEAPGHRLVHVVPAGSVIEVPSALAGPVPSRGPVDPIMRDPKAGRL